MGFLSHFRPKIDSAGDLVWESAEKKAERIEKETYQLPMRLINILEKPENWRKRSLNGTNGVSEHGKELYSKVHRDAFLFKNLYEYLVFR